MPKARLGRGSAMVPPADRAGCLYRARGALTARDHTLAVLQGDNTPADALWISETGSALQPDSLSRRIANLTEERLNHRIPPHWFRDVAATTIAGEAPRNMADAHLVLAERCRRSSCGNSPRRRTAGSKGA
jgi:hypothetical protein